MLIKYVYIVFVGLLLAAFVGVGIAAFYKGPLYPEYPTELKYPMSGEFEPSATPSAETKRKSQEYEIQNKQFQKDNEKYNKNVSILSLIASVLMLVVSLTLFKQILVIADGLLLGGVITLGYSIVRGFSSNDDIFRFLVVSVGLGVALVLGYLKFVKPPEKKK